MGKVDIQRLPVVQQQQSHGSVSRTFFCQRCSLRLFNFKCAVVLMLSIAAFLSAIFWVLPIRHRQAGFDAEDTIKLAATVQAYFKLHRPVSELVPYITRIEYDINEEIGVPHSKVAVLSLHQATESNCTNVVFGFLSDPINSSITPVSLSVLKSSLVDLFLQLYNLTLTSSIFGVPSSFEILKFPGGITIVPEQAAMILQMPEVLFNFTLNSSIYEIKEYLLDLKEQLRMGLQLMPNEVAFIQVTNKNGSTKDPPVTLEASIVSDEGTLRLERLKQLAQRIMRSPSLENLGLNHSVFGKVKEITLSSFLKHSLHAPTPTPTPTPTPSPTPSPSPALSPEQIYYNGPSLPSSSSPSFPPNYHRSLPPCLNCYTSAPSDASQTPAPSPHNAPHDSLSPISDSLAPSVGDSSQYCGSTVSPSPPPTSQPNQVFPSLSPHSYSEPPLASHATHFPPSLSPLPSAAYASQGLDERSGKSLVSSQHILPSIASPMSCTSWRGIWWFNLTGLLTVVLFLWTT